MRSTANGDIEQPPLVDELADPVATFSHAFTCMLLLQSTSFQDKVDAKHVYTDVEFAIGSQFIRHALDDSEPIADLRTGFNPWPGHLIFANGIVPDDVVGQRVFPGSPVSPSPSFWRCSMLTSITHIGSQDLALPVEVLYAPDTVALVADEKVNKQLRAQLVLCSIRPENIIPPHTNGSFTKDVPANVQGDISQCVNSRQARSSGPVGHCCHTWSTDGAGVIVGTVRYAETGRLWADCGLLHGRYLNDGFCALVCSSGEGTGSQDWPRLRSVTRTRHPATSPHRPLCHTHSRCEIAAPPLSSPFPYDTNSNHCAHRAVVWTHPSSDWLHEVLGVGLASDWLPRYQELIGERSSVLLATDAILLTSAESVRHGVECAIVLITPECKVRENQESNTARWEASGLTAKPPRPLESREFHEFHSRLVSVLIVSPTVNICCLYDVSASCLDVNVACQNTLLRAATGMLACLRRSRAMHCALLNKPGQAGRVRQILQLETRRTRLLSSRSYHKSQLHKTISTWWSTRQLTVQPIGNVTQHAIASRTQGPWPEPRVCTIASDITRHVNQSNAIGAKALPARTYQIETHLLNCGNLFTRKTTCESPGSSYPLLPRLASSRLASYKLLAASPYLFQTSLPLATSLAARRLSFGTQSLIHSSTTWLGGLLHFYIVRPEHLEGSTHPESRRETGASNPEQSYDKCRKQYNKSQRRASQKRLSCWLTLLYQIRGSLTCHSKRSIEFPPSYHHYFVLLFRPLARGGPRSAAQTNRGGVVVRLLAFHLGDPGSIPGGVAPGFSHVGIAPLVGSFSRGYPISTALSFRSCFVLTSFLPHRLSNPRQMFSSPRAVYNWWSGSASPDDQNAGSTSRLWKRADSVAEINPHEGLPMRE
ncbi:hypothetical protein PR048_020619 [Dryococelus australis]|uniref:Uncharacterized protein n=1 Tax=Dryococelus australis TaxID=614101 RepID=A0ABQ9H6U5_9NEOP|nr:hypothetical protein PR048_020619 [Dryococelus australis]